MKRLVVTMSALTSILVTLSASMAQRSSDQTLGGPHPEHVRTIESVRELEPTVVHIVVVTDEGRMTLEMDDITAHTLAVQIRNLEMEPLGAP